MPLVGVDDRQLDCLRREVAVLLHTTGECKQVQLAAWHDWLDSDQLSGYWSHDKVMSEQLVAAILGHMVHNLGFAIVAWLAQGCFILSWLACCTLSGLP